MSLSVRGLRVKDEKMKILIEYWNKIWFSRFDPLAVSIFRISLGFLIFVMFICNYFNWDRFYASDGIISLNDTDFSRLPEDKWSVFYWIDGMFPVKVLWWVGFLSAFCFTIGFQTRLATIFLYILQVSMIHRNPLIINGDDLVFRMVLFYSCFSPLNYCLSVDSWLKRKFFNFGKPETELPLIWPIRLMQINVALIYLISLPNKLADDLPWLTGEALYYTAASSMWGRFPFPELFYKWDCLLSKIMTYGTVFVEGTFPFLVWFKETKIIITALLASLHLGIAFFVPNVLFFTLSMVCSFWIFIPSPSIRNFYNFVKGFIK